MKTRKNPLKWIMTAVLVVALIAMGATYAYWADDLVIEAKISTDTFNPIATTAVGGGNVVSGLDVSVNGIPISNTNTLSALPGANGTLGAANINFVLDVAAVTALNSGATVKIMYPVNLDGYEAGSIKVTAPSQSTVTFNPATPVITSEDIKGVASANAITLSVNSVAALENISGTYYAVVELKVAQNSFMPTFTLDAEQESSASSVDIETAYAAAESFPLTLAFVSEGTQSWTSTLNCNLTAVAEATLSVEVPEVTTLAAPLDEEPEGEVNSELEPTE